MAEHVLRVSGLKAHAGSKTLVHGVDLEMAPGERVGLIGESGSGKSITAMSIIGLLDSGVRREGSVELSGVDGNLLDLPESKVARLRGDRMSMVFQEPMTALNPLMRVGRQVSEVIKLHRKGRGGENPDKLAIELLAGVQLPDPAQAAQAYPHQLSGGQRQRVMLAMALANDPELLICDEPTTALDVTVQQQVLDLIGEKVRERGTALLFITHDLAVVAEVCERVLVMHRGRVVEQGLVRDVLRNPQHAYTRGLLAASDLTATDTDGRLFTMATAHRRTAEAVQVTQKAPVLEKTAPAADEVPAVLARGLERTYVRSRTSLFRKPAEVPALRGIDLDIRSGARFGIVGESGSGKSTLLRILAGLDQPTAGSVQVVGQEVAGARPSQLELIRRSLQIVFQDPMGSLDPRMRVRDIISEPLLNRRNLQDETDIDRQRRYAMVEDMLVSVGLPKDAANRFPHQFSGGQRQRISIGRALITRPRVLIADEPVSALDVSVRAQVLNLLSDLVEDYQLTLIFVSHDLSVVRYVCDEVAVMSKGQIVEQGSTEQIYNSPEHDYTRTLVAASPSLHDALERMA